ncbi:MAG: hypothetical protein NC182_06560 [Prevotella sp.]|nr:hypothetical protein [Staphylococcus sp.]MCM1350848.1 hypothetical protein [Prevotella sp.]
MKIFSRTDFDKDGINYLLFDDNFEFDDSNKIIFGFNGVGKTSIYNYLKKTQGDNYQFLDYENKPKFIGSGKKITISIDLSELNLLYLERDNINKRLSVKDYFKTLGIKNKADAESLNTDFSDFYNGKKAFSITKVDETIYKKIVACVQPNEIPELIRNINEIIKITDISTEIKDYAEKYLLNVFDILESNLNKSVTKCPVCGTENVDVFGYINSKRKELLSLSTNLFGKFSYITSKNKTEQAQALNELIEVSKEVNVETLISICISNFNYEEYKKIVNDSTQLVKIEKKISTIEVQRDTFYKAMSENKNFVKEQFEQIYKGAKITFNDKNKEIKIDLPREFNTYSTGELNELCLVIKLLSFKGSSKQLLIIDDPLSSYDFVNQYRIIFRIVEATKNDKKIIVFTHNIETINIINTQYSNQFKYYYIEKHNSKLILEQIKSENIINSILSLESIRNMNQYIDLLVYRENCEEGPLFSGHKVFHYDSSFTFNSNNPNEQKFNGLNNDYLLNLIENTSVTYKNSFEENTITKILYICGIRVWIENKIRNFILSLNGPQKSNISKSFNSKNTTLERLNVVQSMSEFKNMFPNYLSERFMMKKVMLNQDSHYKSQIIPFNFAMNISLDDLINEIAEVKTIFSTQ